MKKVMIVFLWVGVWTLTQADLLEKLKSKTQNIGKKTPIDIALYAKNPSNKCRLSISNISNPYDMDISHKLQPIEIDNGRYYRENVRNLLKGVYEFEYTWSMNNSLIDSSVKTIHVFAYHDIRNKLHKKVNLTFLIRTPRVCK